MPEQPNPEPRSIEDERLELLQHVDDIVDKPLTALSIVWIVLLIIDLTSGLNPFLQALTYIIWAFFIFDFLLEIVIAPNNVDYLRDHWITAVSLLLPALRVLRIFRAFRLLRAARGVRSVTMVRLVTTLNRGMRAIRGSLGRRGIGYVVALTLIITFAGAAGIYYFEGPPGLALDPANANAGVGVDSYGQALWFTTMLMTTIGSDYWPVTTAGRVLTLLMSLYALGVFGYIAGAIASYFVQSGGIQSPLGGDGEASGPPELSEEMDSLRRQIALLNARLESAEAA